MSKKLACIITGNTYRFISEYFHKKMEEYGDEESLINNFMVKKAKSLLLRGYSVKEIRKLLEVDDTDLPHEDSEVVKRVVAFHVSRNETKTRRMNVNIVNNKTDEAVASLINKLKNL